MKAIFSTVMATVWLCASGVRAAEPAFTNVTDTVAPGLPGVAFSSVAWGDYDNDGRLDFLLTGSGVSQLWRNTGTGFVNVTASVAPGLPGVWSASVAWGDYDNDGRLDFLLTGSFFSQLWRNTGSGFVNVTAAVAPGLPAVDRGSVAWGDYDSDGRLDFILTGSGVSQVWRNTGIRFVNVTGDVAPGLPGVEHSSVAWGDYDNDGRLDFLLTGGVLGPDGNYIPVSQLWRNTGSGFVNVTDSVAPGLTGVEYSSVAWGDYDNDGRLDFLLTGSAYPNLVSQLWRNTGSGFTNATASIAPDLPGVLYSSVAWGDFDNDGALDFLLTGYLDNGNSHPVSQLWRNTGDGFTNVTVSVTPVLQGVIWSSAAWGDYDNDGRLDFLLTGRTNASVPGGISQLWRNNTDQTNPPPAVITGLPASVSQTSLALNSRINPRGKAGTAWFVWGDSTNYNHVTPAQAIGNGNSFTNFSQPITGLSTGVTYYYRAVGSNDQGRVVLGSELRFLLAPPVATTGPAELINPITVLVSGQVNPNNLPTYGWIEWGTSPAFGRATPVQFLANGFDATLSQYFSDLAFGAIYYFRAVASNGLGVAYGATQSLAAPCPSPGYLSPPSRSHGYDPEPNYVYFSVACNWTAINTNSWITITSATNGPAGSGLLYYTVALNTDPQPRSGNITIGSTNFFVNQAGGHPVIIADPSDQTVLVGGTASFKVTLLGTGPVTCQWQFNHVSLTNGNGISGASTTNLVLTGVQESQAGEYRVVVAGLYSSPATLTVSCGFTLAASNASFSSLSATGLATLNAAATNCAWSVVNTNPWVTILSGITNIGNGTVVYALAANPTTTARSGSILIADQAFTIAQSGGIVTNAPISLPEALDEGFLLWSTLGTPAWFGQTLIAQDGVDAAQSGAIGDSAAVTVQGRFKGPGTLNFWWKVSSETNKDFLKFFVDGVQQTRISGEVDWQLLNYTFPSGTYTSKWTYSKNDSVSLGNDRGWLDQVQLFDTSDCVVTLSHSNATHSWFSETGQVSVATAKGCPRNVVTLSSWITVVDAGETNGFVRYTLAVNDSFATRTGVVLIAGQPFTVVQLSEFVPCTYSISPASRMHGFASATGAVSVTTRADCAWDVSSTNAWITIVSSPSNSGSGLMFYSVSQNDSPVARDGNIRIGDQFYSISQSAPAPCTYSIFPAGRAHDSASVTGAVSVTTQAGCLWSVLKSNAWVTILSSANDSGSGQVTYSLAANTTSSARSANIVIGGQTFSISQSAAPNTNLMSLAEALDTVGTPLVWTVGGSLPSWSGTTSVTHDGVDAAVSGGIVDGAATSFRTSINGPGTLTFWWKVSSETNSDSLRFFVSGFEQARISGEVNWQQRTVTIPPGVSSLEWVYAKNAALSAGQDRGWVDQIQFVPGSACPISLLPTSASHGADSSTGSVGIAASGCPWSVVNTNPWISIVSATSTNEAGSGTLVYTVDANPSASVRSGNIRIDVENFLVTQLGASLSGTNAPRLQFLSLSVTGATLSVQGGDEGKLYVVEWSEDLIHWMPISTNSAPSTVTDATAGYAPWRFYRTAEIR